MSLLTNGANITLAKPEDVMEMSQSIRQADRDELMAVAGVEAEYALWRGLQHSTAAWTGRVNGTIICLFGVAPIEPMVARCGAPWLIGTTVLERHATTFLRHGRFYVAEMQRRYHHLHNFVDSRNTKAITWLRWLGFMIEEAKPFGVLRLPFHRFSLGE